MIDGNLKDYIQTQTDLFFDVDGYRSVIIESLLGQIHATYINVNDFMVEFGLGENFFDIFVFVFNSDNFDKIRSYGIKCYECSKVVSNQVSLA